MAETVDSALLPLLRDIRKERTEQRALVLNSIGHMRKMEQRLDARIVAIRDDLEMMLKSELLGSLTSFETRIDQRLAKLESHE